MTPLNTIRTPDERFHNLPDYPFSPNYIEVEGMRMHYVDEGEGDPILCLHGEPSWSYLYRKMIPQLSQVGRVIAPDLIGFGKSDKPTKQTDYTFHRHHRWLTAFIEQLDLTNITVVVQDWGGILGLASVGVMPERYARLVVMNTFLPTGKQKPALVFKAWQWFSAYAPIFPIGRILQLATVSKLPKAVVTAYDAPFPSRQYKAGARVFPALVPTSPEMEGVDLMKQARQVLGEWQKPAIVLFSDKDPILGWARKFFLRHIPTAKDQPEIIIRNAGHFLQEDKGEEIAREIVAFIGRT